MSSILKLRILGVRAFDNHEAQELEFATPLTLICGPNGVGKTTVIECLRYVTTGDLPPNAKGGAFVHDPRMASEGEVKAQVKLLFKNTAGRRMVAARNMRLSVTSKGTASFKTLEGFIKVQDKPGSAAADGGFGAPAAPSAPSASLSSRCADLNLQVPLALGISPAILNYVVFCHQEDSLWPLAEPSVVKRRFDEVFEATKYTKALESLKTIRKDYVSNIKTERVEADHLRVDGERAREKHALLAELAQRVERLSAEVDALQKQRVARMRELNAVVEHGQTVQRLAYTRDGAERQIARLRQSIDELSPSIRKLLSEVPSDALARELAECDDKERRVGADIAALQLQRRGLQADIDAVHQKLAMNANQQGRIEQLQDEHLLRHQRRRELAGNGEDVGAWRQQRDAELRDLNEDIDDMDVAHRGQEEESARRLSALEAERLRLKQRAASARASLSDYETQAAEVKARIDSLGPASTDEEAQLKLRLERAQHDLDEAHAAQREFEAAGHLDASRAALVAADRRAEEARAAVQQAIEASSAQSRLQFLRDSLEDSQAALDAAGSGLAETLKDFVPLPQQHQPQSQQHQEEKASNEAAAQAASILDSLRARVETALGSRRTLSAELKASTDSENSLTGRRQQLDAERAACVAKLEAAHTRLDSFDEEIQAAENALLAATEEQEQLQFAHSYFAKALSLAKDPTHASCLLCGHHKTHSESLAFATKLEGMITSLKISPEEAEKEVNDARDVLDRLRAQRPVVEKARAFVSELSNVDSELAKTRTERERLQSSHSAQCDAYSRAVADLDEGERVVAPALQRIERLKSEVAELSDKIAVESSLTQVPTNTKTAQQAQQIMEGADDNLKKCRTELERVRSAHERLKGKVTAASHTLQELKLRASDQELRSANLKQAKQELAKIADQEASTKKEQSEALDALPAAEERIEQAAKELRSLKFKSSQAERKLSEKKSALVAIINKFDDLTREIDAFESMHGADPLAQLRTTSAELQASAQRLTNEAAELDDKLSDLEKQRADFEGYRRNLNDNIRLRRLHVDLERANEELKAAADQLDRANAEMGFDLEQRTRDLQEEVGDLNHQVSTKTGEAKAISHQMQQIRDELATSYSDTAEKYRLAVAKLETSQDAAEDLVKYVKALDAAIMEYHSLKMAEINALLDVMWKRTYMGTDIDTILIRSESDVGASSTRASYNYRVCMMKQDTELDMRGRCSAGQKVLASILIRMALAECFGNNSGLIVLDEPTTNLDRENIEALARSLSDIIESRRSQRNFQLIVITHDEHFLAQMYPSSYCSYYYRITRDSRQLSKVQKLPINGLS